MCKRQHYSCYTCKYVFEVFRTEGLNLGKTVTHDHHSPVFYGCFSCTQGHSCLKVKRWKARRPGSSHGHHRATNNRWHYGQFRVANLLNVHVGKKQQQGKDLT